RSGRLTQRGPWMHFRVCGAGDTAAGVTKRCAAPAESARAYRVAKEACEKATVTLAAVSPGSEIRPLIHHLCESGQLNAGLVLRALLSGNIDMFEEALAELSRAPRSQSAAFCR